VSLSTYDEAPDTKVYAIADAKIDYLGWTKLPLSEDLDEFFNFEMLVESANPQKLERCQVEANIKSAKIISCTELAPAR